MSSFHRWVIVVLGTCLAIGLPLTVRALPAPDSGTTATNLLAQVQKSFQTPYSGYVESLGTLQLPVARGLDDLGPLFGGRTRMRVWWSGSNNWRVDQITPTGELDYIHRVPLTTTWEFEDTHVSELTEGGVRLPRASDLLPPEAARYLLEGAESQQVSRLAAKRIAGRTAPGLRVVPADARSSIDHVDVWADATSGIPLRVDVYDKQSDQVDLTTSFLQFSLQAPSEADTTFNSPPGATIEHPRVIDLADAANRFAPGQPPPVAAGLTRSDDVQLHSVGVYGSGLTTLVAIPLWDDAARPLRDQLEVTPTVEQLPLGPYVQVGPLGILLTRFSGDDGGWLIAGTLTKQGLVAAAQDITGVNSTVPSRASGAQ